MIQLTSREGRRRKGWAYLARRTVVYMVMAMMIVTTMPVDAVTSPGSLAIPDAEDWGVASDMRTVQLAESDVINEAAVSEATTDMLSNVRGYSLARTPAMGPFDLHSSSPPYPTVPDVITMVDDTPDGFLPDAIQLILDQPFKMSVYIQSGETENWVEAFVRRTLGSPERWVDVDIDNDTSTGDAIGNDIRFRVGLVLENTSRNISLIPPTFTLKVRGGIALEMERIGDWEEDKAIDITVFKSFRYSGISYTWFLDYEVDVVPEQTYMSITAENVNVSAEPGKLMDLITRFINGTGNDTTGTRLSDITGPYTIFHTSTEEVEIKATLGYIKLGQNPGDDRKFFEEASWLTASVSRPSPDLPPPTEFAIWLDSPSFNRTFDQLRWTADSEARLEMEYFDARENDTLARALVDVAPTELYFKVETKTEQIGPVAHIHFVASAPVDVLRFDAWDFAGGNRHQYLHTHVELQDLPTELWLNGTIDVGGQEIATLRPDPRAGSFIPQMMESIMVGLTSKLFNIGQTLRALPSSLLEMPEIEGYMDMKFTDPSAHLGMLEMWLTSGDYVTVAPGTDFLAFYNNSHEELVGNMVQSGFSLRLMDLRSVHAEFKDKKQILLDSRYNRELRGLFIDPANHANASLRFSNIPHNISLELMDDQVVYMGDGSVDRLEYTSEIGDQYIRFQMDGVPGGMQFKLGGDRTGLDVLLGEIDSIMVQVTDGVLRGMDGNHLLMERDATGSMSISMRISGVRSLQLDKGERNTVHLETGGNPFGVLIDDQKNDFHLRAKIDPLPVSIEAEVSDLLGLSDIETPSLQDVTSVLQFASIMYQISDLADSVLVAMGDATVSMIEGLGGFSSNLSTSWSGDKNMDLAATVTHGGPDPVPVAPWVHGAYVNMLPGSDGGVLMDAKIYLTGVAPTGSVQLLSDADRTLLELDMEGFTPRVDHLLLTVNGSSLLPEGSGRDLWLYMTDLPSPLDLSLLLDLDADVSIGGTLAGEMSLETSQDLGPIHMRSRVRDDNVATVEALLSNVPRSADLSFQYSRDISIDVDLSDGVRLAYLKMSRDLGSSLAPSTSITLHDVPPLVNLSISGGEDFDMDSPGILTNLPQVHVTTNRPGLDVLVRLEGRAMGNKVDLFMDARDIEEMTMVLSDDEYHISAVKLEFVHISVSNIKYSKKTWIDRFDLAGTRLTKASVKVHMVFGVYPLFQINGLKASGLQMSLVGRTILRGEERDLSVTIFEVPLSVRSMPRSHGNGVTLQEARGEDRLFIPAPMGTLLGTWLG